PVEAINSILRRAGHAVHCTWIPDLGDLPDALPQINPELLIDVPAGENHLKSVIEVRDQVAPTVPVVLVAELVEESVIADAMAVGARPHLHPQIGSRRAQSAGERPAALQ